MWFFEIGVTHFLARKGVPNQMLSWYYRNNNTFSLEISLGTYLHGYI